MKTVDRRLVVPPALLERLSWCVPLVFLIGAPSVLITRFIFLRYYPSHFVNDSPTISETASYPPSSQFFEWTMALVTICVVVFWSLNMMRNQRRLYEIAHRPPPLGPAILHTMSGLLGISAGLFLLLVAVCSLHSYHDIHMFGSWAFYITQATSITLDILFVLWVRALPGISSDGDGLAGRTALATAIFLCSWFFLYMYETKGAAVPEHKYAVQLIYVGAENALAMLFFLYPLTVYRDLRRHFRESAVADQRAWDGEGPDRAPGVQNPCPTQ
jgi:hypothetical protein